MARDDNDIGRNQLPPPPKKRDARPECNAKEVGAGPLKNILLVVDTREIVSSALLDSAQMD